MGTRAPRKPWSWGLGTATPASGAGSDLGPTRLLAAATGWRYAHNLGPCRPSARQLASKVLHTHASDPDTWNSLFVAEASGAAALVGHWIGHQPAGGGAGATTTCGWRRMRLTLPEVASVWTSSRPASWTNQTGVATPLWSRLKLVMLRYLPLNTGGSTAVCWWRSGCSRNASSLIVPASVSFSGLRARLAPAGRRWWRRRSRRIWDLFTGCPRRGSRPRRR
jgi:hypothetical protein